jgi:isoquinoline 1-oxidoreductase beta subunit
MTETLASPTAALPMNRRDLLKVALGAGGAMIVSVALPGAAGPARAQAAAVFSPHATIRIPASGPITFVMSQAEMGQGVYTAMAQLIAEELEVELAQVRLEPAPADDKRFTNPAIGFQVTGGSTSVRGFYTPLRTAGATARLMLVAAAAKQWNVPAASCRAEKGVVLHDASQRRASYGELAAAAATEAVPTQVTLKPASAFKLIGTAAKRLDLAEKVDGRAAFGIDMRLPGMLVATVAACPVFGGKLKSVDDSKAKAVKGVRQVVTLDDAVAVVAEHMGAAKKGLEALAITWDFGANAAMTTADIVGPLATASQKPGVVARNDGNVETALAGAAKTVEAVYELPMLAHATMEPINCTVHVRKDGCDVWVGTQVMTRAQAIAAEAAGLPADKVTVHNHYLGGGFGRRLEVESIGQAVKIARQVDAPVKVVWSREEDIQHDIYRPYYYDRLRAGLDAAGKPVAFHHRVAGSSIMARWIPMFFKDGLDADAVDGAAGMYDFANAHVDYVRQEPPAGLTTTWWRGVGITHNAFMVECFLDECAAAAGKDPVEYRRAILGSQPRARAVLDLAAEKAGWGTPLPAGRGRGVSLLFGFGTYMAQVAEVSVAADGSVRVHRVVCAVDAGTIVNPDTVTAQVEGGIVYGLSAALYGEITFKDGRVEQGNFDSYPVLRIDEAPVVETHIVASSADPGGMGEPSTAGIAPAVANAVFAATGTRLRKLPLKPSGLKRA